MFKIGLGQDLHRLTNDKKALVLGGIIIQKTGGLKADSDGDVILHSICNALSSAIGGNSLGTWANHMCLKQGIKDSSKYVDYIHQKVIGQGYKVCNLTVSVEAKVPRLSMAQINRIKSNIAKLLDISSSQVGITFTSGDDLTALGQGKGIQVLSIVNLVKDA